MNSPRFRSALAPMAALALLAGAGSADAAGIDASVEIIVERFDTCHDPSAEYGVVIDVTLPGPGATAVQASSAAGLTTSLEGGGSEWFGDFLFTDLTTLANQANGLWTITVTGGPYASVSTFTLNISDIDDLDFFPPPSNVQPAGGTISPDTVFSWTDNSGGRAEFLLVDTDDQDGDVVLGDTTWGPPLPLPPGPNSLAVSYHYIADPGTIGPMSVSSGSITWSPPVAGIGAETIACYDVEGSSGPANSVLVILERFDDSIFESTEFLAIINVELLDNAATGIHLTTAGGLDLDMILEDEGDGEGGGTLWDAEVEFGDFDSMKSAVNGEWTISVQGPSPSVSRFDMNVSGLADGDFYASPSNVYPAHDAIGVPADVVVTWDDPTGATTPDFLFVELNDEYDAFTFDGTIDIDATSWDPPGDLPIGLYEYLVGYGGFAPGATAGPITVDSGVIAWGRHPFAPIGHPAQTPLITFGSETAVEFTVGLPSHMEIALERIDDPFNPDEYIAFIDVNLPELNPSAVDVTFASGLNVPLNLDEGEEGADEWDAEVTFPDLDALRNALDGFVTIDVTGPAPSTSQFFLNVAGLIEADFIAPPTDLFPAHGATDVPADVTISWTDPTEPGEADLIFLELGDQEADNFDFGGLAMGDESWTPPADMPPGPIDLYIGYLSFADFGTASPLFVTGGSILWGSVPYAPIGYPNGTPLIALGGESSAHFDVADAPACPGDVNEDGIVDFGDIVLLLGAWGPCEGCPEDRDDNGVIDFGDIVIILGGWGPCDE